MARVIVESLNHLPPTLLLHTVVRSLPAISFLKE